LPVIFYPLIIPLVIMAVKATQCAIDGRGLGILIYIAGYDVVFLTASSLLYDYVLEGD
jgi:ABC-type transport system involved in cytochrome c biogenesis permease component